MTAFILAFVLAADPVSLHLAWEGGDVSPPQDAADRGTESPSPTPDSATETTLPSSQVAESLNICRCGGDPRKKECTCRVGCRCTGYVSLRDAIRAYRESGGQPAYVRGKTDAQHLMDDHGWSVGQVSGLTIDEQRYLHGASHAGAIDATKYVAARVAPFSRGESANQPPGADTKPAMTCFTQASCGPCRQSERYDWSGEKFALTHSDDAPEWVERFPCYYWQRKDGGWHRYYGFNPADLRREWERTQ